MKNKLCIGLIGLLILSAVTVFGDITTALSGIQTEIVDYLGNGGHNVSIALNAEGNPCISYLDDINQSLKYASWDGYKWNIQVVEPKDAAMQTALCFDSTGKPHISYCAVYDEHRHTQLKYATFNGTTWQTSVVEPASSGWFSDIATDSRGYPSISYYGAGNSLKYAHWDGARWVIQVVGIGGSLFDYCSSLAIDSQDNPHISYYDTANMDLRYATRSGSTWSIQTVESEGKVGLSTSIAIDSCD